MPRVHLLQDASAVCCEKNERVNLPAGEYDLVSLEGARPGMVALSVVDPEFPERHHLGGDDGKTPVACVLRAQVPEDTWKPA